MNPYQLVRNAFRSLSGNINNTLINIAGLASGLTVFILIMIYVNTQYSFNTHIPHAQELFRLERGFHGITNAVEGPRFSSTVPEIKNFCRITSASGSMFYRPDNQSARSRADINGIAADSSFLDMFSIEILEKNAGPLLQTPRSVLISTNLAERLFGNTPAVGRLVSMDNQDDLTVEAVFKPLPPTSTIDIDAIFPIDFLTIKYSNPNFLNNHGQWNYETFLRIDKEMVEPAREKILNEVRDFYEASGTISSNQTLVADLRPLPDIYFATIADNLHRHGDKTNTYIFIIIAGFVLLIAIINYINLSTALAGKRSKETGLKKIVGASRASLITQICAEGVIIMVISALLALTASELLLPWYSRFVDLNLAINYSFKNLLIILAAGPLILGTLSGIFPAFYLSRISPVSILRKELVTGKGGSRLRTFLTIFQFSISIFLITGTLIVIRQLEYANSYDHGFATQNIIQVNLNNQINEKFNIFKERSLSHPSVTGITRMNQQINRSSNVWSVFHGDDNFTWPYIQVDEDFVTVFELTILTGQDFSTGMLQRDKPVYLVNQAVVRAFETNSILDETINNHEIVGVVNNFHTSSLKSPIRPVTIGLQPNSAGHIAYFKIEPGHRQDAITAINEIWDELSPDYPFEYEYLTDSIEKAYISEKRFAELFIYFSIVSVLISCLGLFALSSFMTQARIKEICIRKVHGATNSSISILLSASLTGKIIIANIIAWPVAWIYMSRWLDNFAYKVEPGIMQFIAAAIIAQVIALATISWHVYATARKNPAESLKYE